MPGLRHGARVSVALADDGSAEPDVLTRPAQARHDVLAAIASLVRVLEARDPYTSGHSLRVRAHCRRLADTLGLDAHARRHLGLAAWLHDLGKVGVPDVVLNKTTPLSAEETAQIRAHPVIGERILAPIVRQRAVLAAIRHHHERWDGRGYPDGLAGEAIPLLARLIAVADCFDALTTARPYRGALPRAAALDMLRAGAGTQFDPDVTGAFVELGPSSSGKGRPVASGGLYARRTSRRDKPCGSRTLPS